jgi:hypothetical protein
MAIWYIFQRFGLLYQEKYGNPASHIKIVLSFGVRRRFNNFKKTRREPFSDVARCCEHFGCFPEALPVTLATTIARLMAQSEECARGPRHTPSLPCFHLWKGLGMPWDPGKTIALSLSRSLSLSLSLSLPLSPSLSPSLPFHFLFSAAATILALVGKVFLRTELFTFVGVSGLPDGLFSDQKSPCLGTFWRDFERIMLLYFMIFWNILWPFGHSLCLVYGSLV